MTIQAQSADGVIHEFPDGTDPSVIDGAMKAYVQSKGAAAQPHSFADTLADAGKSAWTGIQEGAGKVAGMVGDLRNLPANLASGEVDLLTKAGLGSPAAGDAVKATVGGVTHAATNPFDLGTPLAAAAPTSGQLDAARQGLTGPDYQPHTIAGEYARKAGQLLPAAALPGSVANRVANVVVPAAAGETARLVARASGAGEDVQNAADAVGTLAGGVGANVRIGAPKGEPVPVPRPPSLDELRTQKNAAYAAVDHAGIQYGPSAVSGLVADIKAQTQQAMIDPDLHPQATAIIKRLDQLQNEPITLTKLDQIRRLNRDNVIAGASKDQRRIGYIVQNALDNFVANASPGDLIGGADPQSAAATLSTARDLNTRVAKMESVQTAADKAKLQAGATGSGGNINNALRQKLRTVLERSRGLTDDEQNALTAAVVGTPVQNALRQVGKLSPQGNGLMLSGHLGAAALSHGTTLPVAVAGAAAKAVADGMTQANVQRVMDLMATGGNAENLQLAQMAARDARVDNLVRQLSRVSLNSSTVNALRVAPQYSQSPQSPSPQ